MSKRKYQAYIECVLYGEGQTKTQAIEDALNGLNAAGCIGPDHHQFKDAHAALAAMTIDMVEYPAVSDA